MAALRRPTTDRSCAGCVCVAVVGVRKLSTGIALDRADRRLLEHLNVGGAPDRSVSREQIDRLIDSGLIIESGLGDVYITPRGQLELARWRFRNLPRPRYAVVHYKGIRPKVWQRLFRE